MPGQQTQAGHQDHEGKQGQAEQPDLPNQPGQPDQPQAAQTAEAGSRKTRGRQWESGTEPGAEPTTTAPSPADVKPTDKFDAVGGQPELRRLWEEDPRSKKARPSWLFLSVGVLVVLALIVGGIWYFGSKSDSPDAADHVSPPPVPSSNQPAALEDKLPKLPGTPSQDNSTMALAKAVQVKAVSQADADLMRASGADELVYHSYAGDPGGTLLIAVPSASPAQAAQLVKGLRQNLVTGGFDSSPLGPAATDLVYTGSSPAGKVTAYWYTSGSVAVGVGVSAPLDRDPAALRSRIEQIRAQVAATLPAG
ncbi:flagellar basal body-associated FliL family protein [Amycolatopsis panacis]|uniref:hypothetical protein n=1 Tax=Amycolatopsis panacis TaxID=2340917 RepID=UPI0018F60CFC|nr:hypothetical protein [Amycolatopsis panacis]